MHKWAVHSVWSCSTTMALNMSLQLHGIFFPTVIKTVIETFAFLLSQNINEKKSSHIVERFCWVPSKTRTENVTGLLFRSEIHKQCEEITIGVGDVRDCKSMLIANCDVQSEVWAVRDIKNRKSRTPFPSNQLTTRINKPNADTEHKQMWLGIPFRGRFRESVKWSIATRLDTGHVCVCNKCHY